MAQNTPTAYFRSTSTFSHSPPRRNAKPWQDKKAGSIERNDLLKTVKRLGIALWKNGLDTIGAV